MFHYIIERVLFSCRIFLSIHFIKYANVVSPTIFAVLVLVLTFNYNLLDIPLFLQQDHYLQKRILEYLLHQFYQDDLILLGEKHVEILQKLARSRRANAMIFLPNDILAIKKNNKLENAEFTSYFLKNSIYPYIKLEDMRSLYKESDAVRDTNRIWIDIFAIDGFSNNQVLDFILIKTVKVLRFFLARFLKRAVLENEVNKIKKFFHLILSPIVLLFPANTWAKTIEAVCMTVPYNKTAYVGGVQWGYGLNEKLPKSGIERIDVEFEGCIFPGLKCYEQYLTQLYGNYMEFPPAEKRTPHMASDNVFEIVELDEN